VRRLVLELTDTEYARMEQAKPLLLSAPEYVRAVLVAVLDHRETESVGHNGNTAR
jgi:hypothetical protein